MPIFDFQCKNETCGAVEERMVKRSDDKPSCRKCGSETEKLVSAPRASGYVLKGSGFYKNDGTIDELRSMQKQSEENAKRLGG